VVAIGAGDAGVVSRRAANTVGRKCAVDVAGVVAGIVSVVVITESAVSTRSAIQTVTNAMRTDRFITHTARTVVCLFNAAI
jgi:hypothetical protein